MTNHDLEASVIGGLLLGGYTADAADVLATLPAEAFTLRLYRETYVEIKRQALNRRLIDGLMIAEAMGEANSVNVMQTLRHCPSASNLRGYAEILGEYHQIRQFKNLVEEGCSALDGAHNHEQAIAFIQAFANRVAAAAKPGGEVEPVHIDDLLGSYGELLERRLTQGEASDTLKTGIPELDEITGGMNPEDLVIVAARPGMGKTEFALKVAEGVACSHRVQGCSAAQRGVLIFSMEMSAHQVMERSLAGAAQLPVSSLRKPSRMNDEGWARVASGMGLLAGLSVWVVDASNLSVEQIRAIAERHKRKHPELSLILADYLGLIKKPTSERNDLAIAHISGSLKRMAKDLKTPVMCLSQLSRDVEKRPAGQRRPTNADLRDSGSIEQDADTIIMLYREAVYNANSPAAPYAEIIVTKNRFGELGTVYQQFKNGHFVETDQAEAKSICSNNTASGAKPRRYAQQGEF